MTLVYFFDHYYYYIVSPVFKHVLYIVIVIVLLSYILLFLSFYHSLSRFLTPLDLCAQVGDLRHRSTISLDTHRRLVIDTNHRCFYCLVFISLFIYIFICIMTTDPFLQVFLYFFNAGTIVYIVFFSCTEAYRIYERVFSLCVYTSP